MLLEGTIKNGKVVLDNTPSLSEGTRVKISLKPPQEQPPQLRELVQTLLQSEEATDHPPGEGAGHVS